jgi:hypothetical protein
VNARGGITVTNVLTPIIPGHEPALLEVLDGRLPTGTASPFGRLDSVHFARWVIIGQLRPEFAGRPGLLGRLRGPLRMKYLLFSAAFNGSPDDFWAQLWCRMRAEADDVWSHCVGYPGAGAEWEFCRYLLHNSLPIDQQFLAYQHTVPRLRHWLRLRQQHVDFAVRSQGLDEVQLLKEFCAEFPAPAVEEG